MQSPFLLFNQISTIYSSNGFNLSRDAKPLFTLRKVQWQARHGFVSISAEMQSPFLRVDVANGIVASWEFQSQPRCKAPFYLLFLNFLSA